MSDIMLHGVLNMPPELWIGTPIDVMQRHSRYIQASEYIKELTEQRDRLAAVLQRIRDGYGGQVASPNCCEDCDFLLPIDEALAAVKGGGDDRQPTKDETEDGSPKVGSPPRRRGRRER
jgi:hypothetical protein